MNQRQFKKAWKRLSPDTDYGSYEDAGLGRKEALRLATLPAGHESRPTQDALAVMAGLRRNAF